MSKKGSKTANQSSNKDSNGLSKKSVEKGKDDGSPKVLSIIDELLLMIDGAPTPSAGKAKQGILNSSSSCCNHSQLSVCSCNVQPFIHKYGLHRSHRSTLSLSLSLSLSLYFYNSFSLSSSQDLSPSLSSDASGSKQPPKAKKSTSSFSSTKSVKKSDNLRVVERALLNIDAIIDREKQPNVTNYDSMSDNCSQSNNGNNGNKSAVTGIDSKIVSDMKTDHLEELKGVEEGVKVTVLNGVNEIDTLSTMTSGHNTDSSV